jgi:MFS family permease
VLLAGLALVTLALGLVAAGPVTSEYLRDLFVPMALLGIGAGLAFPALTVLAMARTTPSDSGLASGLLNTTAQVGGALGLAVLATLSTSRTGQLLAQGQGTAAALSGGFHSAWAIGAGLGVVSLVLAATVLKPTVESESSIDEEEISA